MYKQKKQISLNYKICNKTGLNCWMFVSWKHVLLCLCKIVWKYFKQQPNHSFTKFHAHHLNICEHQLWLFNSRLSRIEKIDVVCNNKIQLKSFHLVLEVCHKLLVVGFFSIRLKSQTGHYLSVANFDKLIRITLLWRKKYKS